LALRFNFIQNWEPTYAPLLKFFEHILIPQRKFWNIARRRIRFADADRFARMNSTRGSSV
jgi:hypothetical protein